MKRQSTVAGRHCLQLALTLISSAAVSLLVPEVPAVELAPASTNWLVAQTVFQKAGGLLGEKRFQDARKTLVSGASNLPALYSTMSTQFVQQIDELIREPNREKQTESATVLCVNLQSPAAALKLNPPKSLDAPDDEEDDSVAWSLFENGDMKAALVRYERKQAQERIPVYQDYYKKQVQMIQSWDANRSNPSFALELVRERHMKGYERKVDVFGALRQLHRVWPYATNSSNGVQLCQQFITCLSALRDAAGRDAWENKLLADFKSDSEAAAGVYYDRGIRAYHEVRDFETSLKWMRKLCTEFPNAKLWGDGQYSTGLILQDQKKYDEAIVALGAIFPSKVNDYSLEPGSSEDCKNYRYKAALRTSECYESKNDLVRALEFAEKAMKQHAYVSYCSLCQQQGRAAASKRVADLQAKINRAR